MHVKREHGYGKGAVGFLIGYGLLPFWASCALVLISGGHGTGAEGWVRIHAKAAGDPIPQEGSRHNRFLVLNALLVGLLYLASQSPPYPKHLSRLYAHR